MSASKKKKKSSLPAGRPTPPEDEPLRQDTMSPLRRWTLIGIAVFCLLIFSVTGPMADTIRGWFGSGQDRVYATLELPSGPDEITAQDYQQALMLRDWRERIFRVQEDSELEDVLVYATLMKLADEFDVVITDQDLRNFLLPAVGSAPGGYESLYRGLGFRNALQFETTMRALLRVERVRDLLASGAAPSDQDVLDEWKDQYREIRFQYAAWYPVEFSEAAAALEPEEGELERWFEEEMSPADRAALETEPAVAFDLLVLRAEDLDDPEVQQLLSGIEPTEEALQAFYDAHAFTLYRRPADEMEEGQSPILALDEVRDRVLRDYRLDEALSQASLSLPGEDDVAAWAKAHGFGYVSFDQPIPLSELADLPEFGSFALRNLFTGEVGVWMPGPVLQETGLAFLMRPTEIRERTMPEFDEIRDRVLDLWREAQRSRLAAEAAEAFLEAMPHGDDWVEGDPVVVSEEVFAQAAAADGRRPELIPWVSRMSRPTTDPFWGEADAVKRRLRSILGLALDELQDGQLVGPEDFGPNGIVVAQLIARRPADPERIWPSELTRSRVLASQKAEQRWLEEQLSYAGFAKAWKLTKVLDEE